MATVNSHDYVERSIVLRKQFNFISIDIITI